MTVHAWSGNAPFNPVVHVTVYNGFTLTSDKTSIWRGKTVSFTPKYDGLPGPAARWLWRNADNSSVPNPCIAITNNVCTYKPDTTGTMWAYTAASGGDSANVGVTVVPCPIDSAPPALRDSSVQHDMLLLLQHSNWFVNDGDGIAPGDSIGTKRELEGDVWLRPDGTYYFAQDLLAWSTECFGKRSTTSTAHDPLHDVKVAEVHSEPVESYHIVYGCPPDFMTGKLFMRGPWDTARDTATRLPPRYTGGGSPYDWFRIRDLPENQNAPTVDGYVINADGEVWRLPAAKAPPGITDFSPWINNREMWLWTGNKNPACNWGS